MRDVAENGAGAEAPQSVSEPASSAQTQRKLTQKILIELAIMVALTIPICLYEFAVEPARRGFFCDDESIRYPFKDNTITPVMLGLLVGGLPLLLFVMVEYWRHLRAGEVSSTVQLLGWRMSSWLGELGRQLSYFMFGMLLTFDATEVGKYTIGRLRPHFMAVCQPQMTDGSMCSDPVNAHRYVENYDCAGEGYTIADIRQARLSFPSGHSSMAFYALVYMALYMQRRLPCRSSKMFRHLVQFVLIMVAWYTALSRVMDHWHHWSDVLVGSLIGVLGALITARYIAKFFRMPYGNIILGTGLRRQDTSATLQEVCASTPPPYCANGGYTDEQYCTKV
ncbi:putative phosphatidate phosphatase [Scaptodrosophila lebanonensis]|uniref:Phosphatidate phosphatase n=1 Tax=Drosophila lebanonensis TaxID=7225 RepID=A0A6J2T777_DROLE|nr:putative phosphatidate phosphatase [Scaptodrosophila lebanonensis]XP_030371859.1 putative phosphatidate phosphatase [Scaptodrosophila lebanonensis]